MNTKASVAEMTKMLGHNPIQVDGIPEGFSFKQEDLTIGEVTYPGKYVVFLPLRAGSVDAETETDLLIKYKAHGI